MDYFSSDHHFNHHNIIKYTGRPFKDVTEMDNYLIERQNAVVSPDDTWHCGGDFALSNLIQQKEYLSKLNGKKKILYLGNHDRTVKAMLKVGFDEVYKEPVDWEYGGFKFRISHYPFAPKDFMGFTPKYLNRRPSPEGCDWLLCGHTHEKWKIMRNMFNISVDALLDYSPVSIIHIIEKILELGTNLDPNLQRSPYHY